MANLDQRPHEPTGEPETKIDPKPQELVSNGNEDHDVGVAVEFQENEQDDDHLVAVKIHPAATTLDNNNLVTDLGRIASKDGEINGQVKTGSQVDADFSENSKVQSETGAGDVSKSDESMNIHQESQDACKPSCDQDGRQHIASQVKQVLDAPTPEESGDTVIVSKESVSEAASSEGLSSTNQQESEGDKISGLVAQLPSHALHEAVPSENDTSVNLISDDTRSKGLLEDQEVDMNQKSQDDCSAQSEEVTDVNEKHAPVEKLPENNSQGNLNSSDDVGLISAEDEKESPTRILSGNVSHESADTLSTSNNGPSSLLDSKTAVSKIPESSANGVASETGAVATNSEAAQSVKEGTEPPVASPNIIDGEINKEVKTGSEVGLISAEEGKVSPTRILSGNLSHESADTLSTNTNGPSSLLDSKTAVSKVADSSANGVASDSEAAQSVKESTEPPVASLTITDGEINREVKSDSEACLISAEEGKESPTGILSGDVSHESADTLSTNSNGPSSLLDSNIAVSEIAESSANGVTSDSEAAQSVKEGTEPPVASHTIIDGEINREVKSGSEVCLISAEEGKESPTRILSGDVSHDSADTLSTNTNGPSSLLNSKIAVSEIAESSANGVASDSEAAQSGKEGTKPSVASPTIIDGEINREVKRSSEVDVTKTTSVVEVCEDIPPEEVSKMEESDIKQRSVISSDEEVKEENSGENNNEPGGATASVASETETCAQDLESKVVTSADTIHTGAKDCVDSQPAENKGGDAADRTDDKVASASKVGETQKHLVSASPLEGSVPDASEGQTVAAEIERRPFYFLPRVPRYDDEKLTEQLKHAEAQVDQKTQSRDALRADIQKIRATCKDYDISYKEAMAEERSARKAMHSKRQEIDALQSVISRVKNAASVDDIDSRVHNMEHMIQHETISLSEEKGYIREIKQLKQLREQITSSMGTKDEVKQALDDKEKTEERLKVLRKELDALRNELSKVEAVTKAAKKKCDDEWEVQSKLQEQFRAADAVRQEAFAHLQNLKKQQREKNKFFFKYRDDSRAASEMALKKDRAALQSLCSDQVENFMNKWNNDEEFRSYYIRCNTRSTVRRLGTLDGRSLGPDEEPPRITYATRTDRLRTASDRAEKHETAPPVSAQQEKVVKYEGSKPENNAKAIAKPAEQRSQSTKSKKAVKPDQPTTIVKELVSGKDEIEKAETKEEEEEPRKLTKEEEELIKKEEEKRKQKEAAKMKEQHRLEEIAKAKEAMERKKKREEKAKARAILKAQKEAEEREKEREKKLRKKERRKGGITSEEAAAENPNETAETVVETPREIEIPKKQTGEENQQIKKSHKPSSQFIKHNKSKAIPPPLRNRGNKRKVRQWMWMGLIVVVGMVLFLLGNANLSLSRANLWFI